MPTAGKVRYSEGKADVQVLTAADTTQALTITDAKTIIDGVTNEATANRTINITVADYVQIGAEIVVQSKTNGTQTTVFGTGITGATITGVAGKTITKTFTYDGTTFKANGEQID